MTIELATKNDDNATMQNKIFWMNLNFKPFLKSNKNENYLHFYMARNISNAYEVMKTKNKRSSFIPKAQTFFLLILFLIPKKHRKSITKG